MCIIVILVTKLRGWGLLRRVNKDLASEVNTIEFASLPLPTSEQESLTPSSSVQESLLLPTLVQESLSPPSSEQEPLAHDASGQESLPPTTKPLPSQKCRAKYGIDNKNL